MVIEEGVLKEVNETDIIDGKFVVPEGVTKIGDEAFFGCSSLIKIEIPEGVTEIGDNAFSRCKSLTQIEIPKGVTKIGNGAFYMCNSLTQIEIPEGVTEIGNTTFRSCKSLTQIEIPEGVTKIGNSAFRSCKSLTQIEIPKGVTKIGNSAFCRCESLTQIEIPEGVTKIGHNVFSECISLTQIGIPKGVTEIEDDAFFACGNLTQIKINDDVMGIKEFYNEYNGIFNNLFKEKELETGIITISFADSQYVDINIDMGLLQQFGLIEYNLSEIEQKERKREIEEKFLSIFNKSSFNLSNNYQEDYAIYYITKMINVLGLDLTKELMSVPQNITETEIISYNETHRNDLLQAYERKCAINGDLPVIFKFINAMDSNIINKNDRQKFYTKLNEKLDKIEDGSNSKNVIDLISDVSKESGMQIDDEVLKNFQLQINQKRFLEKSEYIKSKINEQVQGEDIHHIGIVKNAMYNVIKHNIYKDGTIEDLENVLETEFQRTRTNGELYYGEGIQEQKNEILELLRNLYEDKQISETIVDVLKNNKQDKWIFKFRKLFTQENGKFAKFDDLSEQQRDKLYEELQKLGITFRIQETSQYKLKDGKTEKYAFEKLMKSGNERILTFEKAEMMFSNMKSPYSENFREWFKKHREEIMQNSEYYRRIATVHNEFEYALQDPSVMTIFRNGNLSVKKMIELINSREKSGRPGNEEYWARANKVDISIDEAREGEDLYEKVKQREGSFIPQVRVSGSKKYRGRILRVDDPMNILAGNATDCCQRVGAPGQGAMEHGALTKNGRLFVVEEIDNKGNLVAVVTQSWIWRNKDVVCFDNIEIPVSEQERLKESTKDLDVQEQQEILKIYQETAENLIEQDRKTIRELLTDKLKKGEITQKRFDELYSTLALKSVTVGTGYNDLGVLENPELEKVNVAELVLPRAKEFETLANPWIDSGRNPNAKAVGQMQGNDGSQYYLARAKDENGEIIQGKVVNNANQSPDIEDLGVEYLYRDSREVIHAQGRQIDMGVIGNIKRIEDVAYRNRQKVMSDCKTYKDIANIYEIDPEKVQIMVSSKKDWYMIYTENEDELYIADVAMLNGVNSQKQDGVKTDVIESTFECAESVYELMLENAKQGKTVKLATIEDTSYKNIMRLAKKGAIVIEKEEVEEWRDLKDRNQDSRDMFDDEYYDEDYNGDEYKEDEIDNAKNNSISDNTETPETQETTEKPIMMHNMTIAVNQEKLEKELNRIKEVRQRKSKIKISSLPRTKEKEER